MLNIVISTFHEREETMIRPEIGSNWTYGGCRLVFVGWSFQRGLQFHLHHKKLYPLTVHIDETQFNYLVEKGDIKKQEGTKAISGAQAEMIAGWD